MTEQDKQALIKHFCSRDCGEAAEGCTIMPCHEIELIQEFPTSEADSDTISRQAAIDALGELATFTDECSEHTWMYTDDVYKAIKKLPPARPEQLEQCPIYGGMCAYPSNQCYDCPRHAGAKMEVTE